MDVSHEAKQQLADDLEKAPMAGERIIEHLLNAQAILTRENAELRLQIDKMLEGMRLLTELVDRNRLAIEQMSQPPGIVH